MGGEVLGEADVDILHSMWPDELENEPRKQFNMEKPGVKNDLMEEVSVIEEATIVDFKRLLELTDYSRKGSSQLAYLVKHWEYKQANAIRLLNEELNILSKQRHEVELKKLEILEQHRFEEDKGVGDKRPISILDEIHDWWDIIPRRTNDVLACEEKFEIDAECETIKYWKQRAMELDKMLEESIHREQKLMQKFQEKIKNLEMQSSPVEELSQILKRADNFLHFVLQNAPVVIGHQDKELRYRFIYNHFPSLEEEDIIGKTDIEIFTGAGVDEIMEFKREVLERGLPAKREMTFETELFGLKTFLIYVEPVFSKTGDTIGVNYMGMDVTDQVVKREKMAKLREEIAVQKAKETELNKTIHITEETMRAKQMLATMSHEIRSPLTGVVSMAEILASTKMDNEQRQLLDVMISSGDLVLQLINDILDLSKVESGVMKLEATKFRPREVVKYVLQTAAASLQKELILEGNIADDVPVEVIGDVLRIRQILTNLISNAIKFTHRGKVGINLYVIPNQCHGVGEEQPQILKDQDSATSEREPTENSLGSQCDNKLESSHCSACQEDLSNCKTTGEYECSSDADSEDHHHSHKQAGWLRCDVYDTGIGIPEKALPSLFKKYMQASADHARKYGGTGLGLAICKQLVELMGGQLTVTSEERHGSTFTFVLPCKVPSKREHCDDQAEILAMSEQKLMGEDGVDEIGGTFHFKPHALGVSYGGSMSRRTKLFCSGTYDPTTNFSRSLEDSESSCTIRSKSVEMDSNVPTISNSTHGIEMENRKDEESRDNKPCSTRCKSDSHGIDSREAQRNLSLQQQTNSYSEEDRRGNESRSSERDDRSTRIAANDSSLLPKLNSEHKILLVEDNMINIMVAQSMMKQLGYKIDVAKNGLEAIHAFQHSPYDLILMDVCMPVMDGLQATRLIRSFEENGYWDASVSRESNRANPCSNSKSDDQDIVQTRKRTPIVAMTANALAESAADCIANGMDSFVSKPVTFQTLNQCLQQYLPP